ncbi:glycosyltransferase family 39 protein [Streptosporangium sp. NPDC087985]|uniref:glycosyltransferase family 39 protein n=1 Tax=Streptosporangium sp. NPDC087985 TaxID=3366196 RepID=UPI003820E048
MSQSSDEMATLSAARRSATGLWELTQHIDGHFLPYYAFMHLWLEFGQAQWWLRLPSAIATGVAASLIADLGRRLHSLPAGVTAATVYVFLPSVSYHGQNVRSYAFAAAAAVLAAWTLHRAVEEPERRGWWKYAAAVALLGCTQVFALLVLSAHLLAVALYGRGVLVRMLPFMAAGCAPGAVWAAVGFNERHAISWIELPDPTVFLALPCTAAGTAPAGYVLVALAPAAPLLLRRHRPHRLWVTLLAGWALLPPILLFGLSHLAAPVYVDRYLFATVPAYALLAGLALASMSHVLATLLLATTLIAGLPGQLDLRREDGHHENFPRAVRIIAYGALPGDAIMYGGSWLRTGMLYYGGRDLADDVLLRDPAPLPGSFDYPERTDIAAALDGHERVWMLWRGSLRKIATGGERIGALVPAGFTRRQAWRVGRRPSMTVALYTRWADPASRTSHRRRPAAQ